MILVHNHPSGDPTPSKADIQVPQDIKKAAAPLGAVLHDHVIIGRNRHTSLRELGEIQLSRPAGSHRSVAGREAATDILLTLDM